MCCLISSVVKTLPSFNLRRCLCAACRHRKQHHHQTFYCRVELELAECAKGKQSTASKDVKEDEELGIAASEAVVVGGHKDEIVE